MAKRWVPIKTERLTFRKPFRQAARPGAPAKWLYRQFDKDEKEKKVSTHTLDLKPSASFAAAAGRVRALAEDEREREREGIEQAERERIIAEREKLGLVTQVKDPVSVGEGFDRWLDLKASRCRPSTMRGYRSIADELREFFEGRLLLGGKEALLHEITTAHIDDFIQAKSDQGALGNTLQNYLNVMSNLFKWAKKKRGHVAKNPQEGYELDAKSKREKEPTDADRSLTLEAQRALVRAAGEPQIVRFRPDLGDTETELKAPRHLQRVVVIALRSGLRRSNILRLRWKWITFTTGAEVLTIPGKPEDGEDGVTGDYTKSHRSLRVPLHKDVIRVLLEQRREIRTPREFVFEITDFKRAWRSLVRRAGLDERGLRFHDLRHCFQSDLDRADVSRVKSKLLMGHHAKRDISDRYSHATAEELRAAVNRLPSVLGRARKGGKELAAGG